MASPDFHEWTIRESQGSYFVFKNSGVYMIGNMSARTEQEGLVLDTKGASYKWSKMGVQGFATLASALEALAIATS